ncbi:MAG: hypothetical protein AB1733_18690 [Thermodesulfobacteriota bacterium]
MRLVWRFVASLLCTGLCLLATSGSADDAPVWLMGGGATPKSSHTTVRMDSEEVTIRLHKDSYTVDAVFRFFNTGDTTTEWVGFPKRGLGSSATFTGTRGFIQFETWVGDQRVPFREERELWSRVPMFLRSIFSYIIEDNRWLVKEVTFPGHKETTTRVKYEAHYYGPAEGNTAYYIYGTGSHWKGPIGKARFILDASEIGGTGKIRVNLPEESRRQVSESSVIYELNDFDPSPHATLTVFF